MIYVELNDCVVVCVRNEPYPPENPWTIEAPDEVECGWIYDGSTWTAPPENARKTQRAAMAAQLAALPAWITGPFGHLFERASACLDDGKDDAAAAIIQYAEPPSAYSEEQRATFIQVRDAFAESLASLGS